MRGGEQLFRVGSRIIFEPHPIVEWLLEQGLALCANNSIAVP
jgi:hypothetical protein